MKHTHTHHIPRRVNRVCDRFVGFPPKIQLAGYRASSVPGPSNAAHTSKHTTPRHTAARHMISPGVTFLTRWLHLIRDDKAANAALITRLSRGQGCSHSNGALKRGMTSRAPPLPPPHPLQARLMQRRLHRRAATKNNTF